MAAQLELTSTSTCKVCGTLFDSLPTGRKSAYCSSACKQKAYRLRNSKRNAKPVTKDGVGWVLEKDQEHPTGRFLFVMVGMDDGTILPTPRRLTEHEDMPPGCADYQIVAWLDPNRNEFYEYLQQL